MADENFGPVWPPANPQGEPKKIESGEGEVPLDQPMPPKIDVRTFASDLNSMKESGGATPRPYVPPPIPTSTAAPASAPAPVSPPPEKSAEAAPAVQCPPAPSPVLTSTKKKSGLFTAIVVLIIVGGLGAAGYFFVYPYFFKTPSQNLAAPQNQEVSTNETPPPPVPVPVPEIPQEPEPSPTPPAAGEVTSSPAIQEQHSSLFKIPADATSEINVGTLDLASLHRIFDQTSSEVPLLKELVLKENGALVKTAQLMAVLAPSAFTSDVVDAFEADPTVFEYQDDKGVWPGFIFKLKEGVSQSEIGSKVARIESGSEILNAFLKSPGAPAGDWKSGQTSGIQNRYLTFTNTGYALNYGWVRNNLLISTSYNGFKEAMRRLQ